MILLIRSSRKEKIIDDNFHGAIIIKIVINLAEGEAGGENAMEQQEDGIIP